MQEIESKQIKDMLLNEGIDLVGIADAQSLLLGYPPRPATRILPNARSVIVMAVAHSLGAVFSPDIKIWTRNKMQTSRLLDQVGEKLSRWLEKNGFISVPISADKPVEIHKINPETGKKFKRTRVLGQFSLKHAAVSAGLGKIGRSNLLLTRQFGPHQRLGAIITSLEMEPDVPDLQEEICLRNCRLCEKACPVNALADGKFDVDRCFAYWSTGFEMMRPENLRDLPKYVKMLWRHSRERDAFIEMGQTYMTDVDFCIECMKACPVGEKWKGMKPRKAEGEEQEVKE